MARRSTDLRMLLAGSTPTRRRKRSSGRSSSRSAAPSPDVVLTRTRGPSYQRQVSSQAARTHQAAARQTKAQRLSAARALFSNYTPRPGGPSRAALVREFARSDPLLRRSTLGSILEVEPSKARREIGRMNLDAPGGDTSTLTALEIASLGIPGLGLATRAGSVAARGAIAAAKRAAGQSSEKAADAARLAHIRQYHRPVRKYNQWGSRVATRHRRSREIKRARKGKPPMERLRHGRMYHANLGARRFARDQVAPVVQGMGPLRSPITWPVALWAREPLLSGDQEEVARRRAQASLFR